MTQLLYGCISKTRKTGKTNGHINTEGGKFHHVSPPRQKQTNKNYRQPMAARRRKIILSQGCAPLLVVQRMDSPKIICPPSTKIDLTGLLYLYIFAYTHITVIIKEKGYQL